MLFANGSDLMMAFSLFMLPIVLQVLEATPTFSLFNILHKAMLLFHLFLNLLIWPAFITPDRKVEEFTAF